MPMTMILAPYARGAILWAERNQVPRNSVYIPWRYEQIQGRRFDAENWRIVVLPGVEPRMLDVVRQCLKKSQNPAPIEMRNGE
jgi:hypothetical protein